MEFPNDLTGAPWRQDSEIAVRGLVRLDYAELEARVSRREAELLSQGLSANQVVLVPEVPALDLLVMQHALGRLGSGLFPISRRNPRGHDQRLAEAAGAEWRWLSEPDGERRLTSTGLRVRSSGGRPAKAALVIETSGTGGEPKAVMLTSGNVLASAALTNRRLGLRAGDCWLSCLPRSHVGGLMIGYRCALAGAAVLLHERFDAVAVARDLEPHGVTHLSLVPPMLARLLAVVERPPPGLRVLLVGGQTLSSTLAARAIDRGWPLRATYGMTETSSQIATSDALETVPEPDTVGPVLPGIQVRCRGTLKAPAAIAIRGPVVMAGYANPERLPGVGLSKGWLVTNDVGYFDDAGDLAVVGRSDDILVIGGEALRPSRVEDRIMSAPGMDSVVVVGFDDQIWGARLVAAYVGDIDCGTLDHWCREHLSDRERPREFRRVSRLPLLNSGKPDRGRVKDMIARWPGTDSPATTSDRSP